jgi:hypothetical protein
MKKTTLFCFLVAICLVFQAAATQAATIALWTFETNPPATAGPFAADEGLGTATALHADATTTYSNPNGNGSPESWNSNRWAIGDYYLFQVSTLGASGVEFSWDQLRSSAGPGAANVVDPNFRLQYSTDGTNFTNVVDYLVPVATWDSAIVNNATKYTQDLSSILALNNQPTVYFRLTAILAPQNTGGQSRVDNIRVTVIPEPTSLLLMLVAAAAWVICRRRT